MTNYKVLIVQDNELLLKQFEAHYTDEETVKDVDESYLNWFNDDCEAWIFSIV